MSGFYLWLKAFHIMAVIAWMAGLFYLPRLFVYHCGAVPGSVQSETFKVMEQRLLAVIMTPAMIIAWLSGLTLAWLTEALTSGFFWLWAKLVLVVAMSALQGLLSYHARHFAADANTSTDRYFRFINEFPTLLMIAIVLLAVVKPF